MRQAWARRTGRGGASAVGRGWEEVPPPPSRHDASIGRDLDVVIDLSHTWVDDLDVTLTAPNGTIVDLFSDVGGSGDDVSTTLDDEAATSIATATAPFTGTFQPEGSLASFDGVSPVGTWTLTIVDDAAGDDGTLHSWSLILRQETADGDNDGFYTCDDCDDAAATAYPGAPELCNGADDDCNGTVPGPELDGDGDGTSSCGGDCDDTDAGIGPGELDVCGDGIDQDCVAGDLPCTGTAGDVVINEVMSDPDAVSDSLGEWIELYNPGSGAVTLRSRSSLPGGGGSGVTGSEGRWRPLFLCHGSGATMGTLSRRLATPGGTVPPRRVPVVAPPPTKVESRDHGRGGDLGPPSSSGAMTASPSAPGAVSTRRSVFSTSVRISGGL